MNLLERNEKPDWVVFPQEYLELVYKGDDEFLPWYLMDKEQLLIRFNGMKNRYPNRSLFPFARDDQSDDVACWEKDKPGKVVLIHDFASPGYENKKEFENFKDWHEYVISQY